MEFRTELTINQSDLNITHTKRILCMGSCFAEHIAQRLSDVKFQTMLNPFGIVYNPISISEQIDVLLKKKLFDESDVFQQGELWHSFLHHGHFSGLDKEKALEKINKHIIAGHDFLQKADVLIITLGTATIFFNEKRKKIVANCHKVPQNEFEKTRLSLEEVVISLQLTVEKIRHYRTDLEIIFTVSPIRHIKDGIVENQRSKAILLLAIDNLLKINDLQKPFLHYFPAYEIMMDDLRDYRFYEKDMIHPTQQAIDYIWEKFQNRFFSKETKDLIKPISQIVTAAQHRPFFPESIEYQKFVKHQIAQINKLTTAYPFLDFEKEKIVFDRSNDLY